MTKSKQLHDVYSFGVISHSTLYLLRDHYPRKSGYAEISRRYMNIGGEAANTSLVLARLGLDVKIDGNWLNPDDDASFVRDTLIRNGIDVSRIVNRNCRGPKEMLVVDADSRTIFGTYAQMAEEGSWNRPQKTDIENSRIVCLDPFFGRASHQVVEYARLFGKPIVTVDCTYDDPVFGGSSIAVISEEYLRDTYTGEKISELMARYTANARGIVIFTFGSREILYGSRDRELRAFKPFEIDPTDTTGAGDSFRAGIIYGEFNGWVIEKSIEFASALAALVCQSFPGVLNSPSVDRVMAFINEHR